MVIALSALLLVAIHPLTFGSLTSTDDGLLHLYRLIGLDHALRHGDLWPRYVPGLAYGYGLPLFNFYSPLSLYPFEALHLLGLPFVDAMLIGLIAYTLVGGWGAYRLGEIWAGPEAGIGAAAAWSYAPYLIHNLLERGAVGEYAALAILPWALWAWKRLADRGARADFTAAVVTLGLIVVLHNITALMAAGLIPLYGLYLWWTSADPPRAIQRLALAGLFALALTAFYWLPVLAEGQYAQLGRAVHDVSNDFFRTQYQTVGQTLALPATADLTRLNPPIQRVLGWPQIALALAGVALLYWHKPGEEVNQRIVRRFASLALTAVILLIFLISPASAWLWQIVPGAGTLQYPWRLLGPASLLLALLAGIGLGMLARQRRSGVGRLALVVGALAVMILYAMPWLYRLYIPDPPADGIVDAQNFERETGKIGGTAGGEYLPVWTVELPDPDRLTGLYAQGEVIPRLQPVPDVTVEAMTWRVTGANLTLDANEETTLLFDWLYFPGWWAALDGESVAVTPTGPQGYVGVTVPSGQHTLELGFGPTPLRLGAMIASLLSLAGMVAVTAFADRLWNPETSPPPRSARLPLSAVAERRSGGEVNHPTPTRSLMLTAALTGALIFGAKVFLIDNLHTPIQRARFANGLEAGLQTSVMASYADQITLLGYDLTPRAVQSGGKARLTLYWQTEGEMVAEDYSSVVYVRDPVGNIIAQTGEFYPGGWATSRWVPGFYVQETLDLEIPPGTPPGDYSLHVGLYWPEGGRDLDVAGADGNPLGVNAPIGMLEVTRPARPLTPADLARVDAEIGLQDTALNEDISLIRISPPPASMEVGDWFALVVTWRADSSPQEAYRASLIWLDDDGEAAASTPPFELATGYPTDQWRPGDVWRGVHRVYVPGRLESGDYTLAVQLVDERGAAVGEPETFGPMAVTTPDRTYTIPQMDSVAGAEWDNGIQLLGYDLPRGWVRGGDGLSLTLYWRADTEISESLTVFVHLYNEDGQIVAQADSIPAAGSRPTTGWAPGEVVADAYALFIEPSVSTGRYSLRIGWYDAATGHRVVLTDGTDFWILPQMIRVLLGP